jgi:oligopeptide transport system substrate-binding protein
VELRKLRDRKEYRTKSRLSTYYYGVNVKKPPMDDVNVRKAIAQAIDRKQIVQVLNGGQVPMTSWVPVGMFGYEAERGLAFNPEKAKEALAQAGYGEGKKKFPKIELKFNTLEDHQLIAENVQAQLKKNLGIDLELKNEEWKVYMNSIKTEPPHMFRYGWQADYPDPDNFFAVLLSYSENNHTRWKNPKFDELIEKAASAATKDERRKIYSEAHRILVEEEVPIIPFYNSVSHILVSPRVQNYPLNVMELFIFRGAKIQ